MGEYDFNDHRNARRNTDPGTSDMAAQEVTFSGKRENQAMEILKLVKVFPGRTSRELAEICKFDRYQLARRLSDLKNSNLVVQGESRICDMGKRPAVTWWVGP